jgi:broad specificity phosphatase PhoE
MKIFIARHGETDSNKASKLQGQRVNDDLNALGIKQAEELASKLVNESFDVIFTSPLVRAVHMANIIAEVIKAPIVESRDILERDFGIFSGKTWEEMKVISNSDTDFRAKDFAQEYDYRPYEGESVEDVKTRLIRFIDMLKRDYTNKKVLIVAHGGIMKEVLHGARD